MYGYKLIDTKGGSYTRWFNGSSYFTYPVSRKLEKTVVKLRKEPSWKKQGQLARKLSEGEPFVFQELTEDDWNKVENPVKKFFRKIFG